MTFKQIKDLFTLIMIVGFLAAFYIAFFLTAAYAQEAPPHVIKGYMTHEDSEYWYHLQTLSDGTEREHKVRKPKPPNPYISRQLIATNDLPVQVQYVYRVLRQDLTVITNTVTRTKTAKDRIKITLPPPPDYTPPEPGRTDALGQVLKRQRVKKNKIEEEVTEYKMRKKPDSIISRKVIDGKVHNTHVSGKVTVTPLTRMRTAKVKSAPVKTRALTPADFEWNLPADAKWGEDYYGIGDMEKHNKKGQLKK